MNTNVYPALGALLECPAGNYGDLLDSALRIVSADCPEASVPLAEFKEELGDLTRSFAEESYLRAFDIAPLCVPYVSVHLFGEENYRRGEFMARLREAYEGQGFETGGELPDHLSVLLGFVPKLSDEERAEMLELCLKAPLEKMRRSLDKAENPYRLLLRALAEVIEADLCALPADLRTPFPMKVLAGALNPVPFIPSTSSLSPPGRGGAVEGLGGDLSCAEDCHA